MERSGLSDRAVVSRRDDGTPARFTCAARSRTTARSACRATPTPAAAASAARRRRRHTRWVAASPGYIAPDRTDPDVFFAGANNGTFLTRYNRRTGELKEVGAYPALLLRRAVEGRQGTMAVDLPDHLFATSIRRCSTPARSACGARPTAATRGKRSAAISAATIRRRSRSPAVRSRTT